MSSTYHPYHLVDPSPWPYITACGVTLTTLGAIGYFHYGKSLLLFIGVSTIVFIFFVWCRDIIRESTFLGFHTSNVKRGLKWGMLLFITSEICFFFAFFWAFFHSSLAPTIELGTIWPPRGIEVLNPFSVPLLNTALLLSSGATVTWAHHALISNKRYEAIWGLSFTVILGLFFTTLQVLEYYEASFSIADSVYGSIFFVATGFHGIHVIVGTTFLFVCLIRLIHHQFTMHHHFGFEAASWYWHFVDVVWLFLYVCIYWWGS